MKTQKIIKDSIQTFQQYKQQHKHYTFHNHQTILPFVEKTIRQTIIPTISTNEPSTTVIIGQPLSAKTYYITQYLENIDHYQTPETKPTLTYTIEKPAYIISDKTTELYAETIVDETKNIQKQNPDHNILTYTNNLQTATILSTIKNISVLCETEWDTFENYLNNNTTSTFQGKWSFIGWGDPITNPTEITALAKELATATLGTKNIDRHTLHKIIAKTIETLQETNTTSQQQHKENEIKGSIGIWANYTNEVYKRVYLSQNCTPPYQWDTTETNKEINNAINTCKNYLINTINQETQTEETTINDILDQIENNIDNTIETILNPQQTPQQQTKNKTQNNPQNTPKYTNNPKQLENTLKNIIYGQNQAITQLVDTLTPALAGITPNTKPLRSILLTGPTGVGKTETVIETAKHIANKPLNLIRLDMSEYSKDHEIAKLLGSPPGYIGHDTEPAFIEQIQQHPHSIILLDEVEKAHPKIWDTFLQILDAGRLTTAKGKTLDLTKTIIFMTSNLGTNNQTENTIGFNTTQTQQQKTAQQQTQTTKEIEQYFKPELLNRIDATIHFQPLQPDTIEKIVKAEIQKLNKRLTTRNATLKTPTKNTITKIAQHANTTKYGARNIQRTVEKLLTLPLSKQLLQTTQPVQLTAYYNKKQDTIKIRKTNPNKPKTTTKKPAQKTKQTTQQKQ